MDARAPGSCLHPLAVGKLLTHVFDSTTTSSDWDEQHSERIRQELRLLAAHHHPLHACSFRMG